MEKPLCKICKERHYGLCPQAAKSVDDRHRGNDAPRRGDVGTAPAKPAPSPARTKVGKAPVPRKGWKDQTGNDVVDGVGKERPIAASSKAKFDRNQYQRDYVARWRRGEVGNKHKGKL